MGSKKNCNSLEKTVQRLREERENKRKIINAIQDGIVVFKPNLTVQIINQQAQKMLHFDASNKHALKTLPIFKNKKGTIAFKLEAWLSLMIEAPCEEPIETHVWVRDPTTLESTALFLNAKALFSKKGKLKTILLSIYDRSASIYADEQKRLMMAAFNSFNGQFIANEKGYIVQPNDSFIAMTGLTSKQLKAMTLMTWLEKQISLKIDTNDLLRSLLEHKFWSDEVTLHPRPDLTFYAVLSISMIADDEYNIEHYIVTLQNITEIKEAHQKLEQMAFYDHLTGLANRKLALEYIQRALTNHHRYNTYSALLYINLDRFKSINDAFGRKTGDQLLKQTATQLKTLLRPNDVLARVGGDEFVILTQDRAATAEVAKRLSMKMAKTIAATLNQHYDVDELTLHSTVRIGLIVFPHAEDDSADNLLKNADLAMTQAKNLKHNHKIFVYEPSLSEEVKERRQLEIDLNSPELDQQLQLYYQPQFAKEEIIHGAEALVRWRHPTLGFISPGKFISIAEESRQILKLGAWVLTNAFLQAKQWTQQQPNFNLSVNISPIQFHEADFVDHVITLLKQTAVNPQNITLELTEGVLISDTESALDKIEQLDQLGFKISIDDFGTGYSSLSYLQKLPIHELKIDKSFIFRVPESLDDIAIVESIIRLAQAKNLTIVAEGVETQAQANFIRQQPENILIQGYFYSKPCNASQFESLFLDPDRPALEPPSQ